MTPDERQVPEHRSGAEPADGRVPEHNHGAPLDEPQPSAPRKPERDADEAAQQRRRRPWRHARGMKRTNGFNRAYLEALLEGVPLPATRQDLITHAKRDGSKKAANALKALPSQRYGSLDEVGEHLQPVQPQWPRTHRVPRPESDLPPGGADYGANDKS